MISAGGTGRAAGNARLLRARTALGGTWEGQVVRMGRGGDVSKATITGRVEIWTQLKLTENVLNFKATLWIGVYTLRNGCGADLFHPFLICVLPGLQMCNLTISVTEVAFELFSAQCICVCCNFLNIDDTITSILTLISSCPRNPPFPLDIGPSVLLQCSEEHTCLAWYRMRTISLLLYWSWGVLLCFLRKLLKTMILNVIPHFLLIFLCDYRALSWCFTCSSKRHKLTQGKLNTLTLCGERNRGNEVDCVFS